MALPSTNLTMGAIQAEFGGTNPILMSEYYRGGLNVPSSQTATPVDPTPIPTSGTIRMGEFRGQTKATTGIVSLWVATTQNISLAPGARTVNFAINTTGTTTKTGSLGTAPNWYTPTTTGIGSSYWVNATFVTTQPPAGSGNTMSGSFGTWTSMGSTQSWQFSTANGQTEWVGTLTIQISATSGGTVIGTGTVTVDVGYTP